ncbi:MAG: hypothetical protein WAU50_10570, partial [Candidatus Sulfotelmatobacter sp.]
LRSGNPYMVCEPKGEAGTKLDHARIALKCVPQKETPLKIKLFHSAQCETTEYNSIWSRKCGT